MRTKHKRHFKWAPFSKKQLQILTWWCDDSPVKDYDGIIADGAIRSGKTISMSFSFVNWAMTRFSDTDFALCGKTIGSLRRNVINTLKSQIESVGFSVDDNRSENVLTIYNSKVTNYFYLFGGKDESSQDLIQGITLGGVLLDEVALMPKSFVDQAVGRCSVEGAKIWYNCNPKGPTHYFKTDVIDEREKQRLLYLHFTMDDNLTLSEETKERYRRQFAGVFYDRNILGLWVTAEGKIYISFTKDNVIDVKEWYKRDAAGRYTNEMRNKIVVCTAGVDFGGSLSSTTFTASGFTKAFQETIVLKERRIKEEINPVQLENYFVDFIKEVLAEYPMLKVVYCDSAEKVLIRGLKMAAIRNKLPIEIVDAKKGEIIDRIRFGLAMFAQHRFFIVSNCTETISAYRDAVWDEKHEDTRLDDGTTNIDSLDSAEYSQEPYMKTMIDLTNIRR